MMGYSTLQSRLEYRRWAERLGLDDIVYVFCENDPGNHIPAINRSDAVPYPVLSGDSVAIDASFREPLPAQDRAGRTGCGSTRRATRSS